MPTVPRYERGVVTAPLPGARKSAAETPLSTGAGVSRAREQKYEQIAHTTGQLGGIGLKQYTIMLEQERDRADDVAMLEANNRIASWRNKRLYDPQAGAFTQQGKNAMGLPEQIATEYETLTGEIEAGLSTDRQRAAFQKLKGQNGLTLDLEVRRHVFGEMQKYEASELTATVENSYEAAVANAGDPDRIGLELDKATESIKRSGPRLGWGPQEIEKRIEDVTSATHVGVIEQLLARNKTGEAKIYFDDAKTQISGPALGPIQKAVEDGTLRAESQKAADKIIAEGGTYTEQLEKVRAITDPKLRDETQTRVEHQRAIDDRLEREAEQENLRSAYDIVSKTHTTDSIPAAQWSKLGASQPAVRSYALSLAKGVPIETNWQKYYSLMDMVDSDPGQFVKENLYKYRAQLSDTEFTHLTSLQLSVRSGNREKAEKDYGGFRTNQQILDDTLTEYGIDPNAKQDTPEARTIAQLRRHMDRQVAFIQESKHGKASVQDIQEVADNLMSQTATVERGRFNFWSPTTKRLVETEISDIPKVLRQQVEQALRKRRMPVNDQTILDLYIKTRLEEAQLAKQSRPGATGSY